MNTRSDDSRNENNRDQRDPRDPSPADDEPRYRSRTGGGQKKNMIKFFLGGSGVLLLLIAALGLYKFGPSLLGSGSGGGTGGDRISFSAVRKEAEKHLNHGNRLYNEANNKESVKLYREAISQYSKGKQRLKKYEDQVNKAASSGGWSVETKRIWRNLASMNKRANKKLRELQGGASGPDQIQSTPSSGPETVETVSVPELPSLSESERSKITTAVDRVNTVKKLLHRLDGNKPVDNRKKKLDRARNLFKQSESTILSMIDEHEQKPDVAGFLQSVKFDHLMSLKNRLDGVQGTK